MYMKAAVLEALNRPLALRELEIPTLKSGQVLVHVAVSGICGAQLGEISGSGGDDKYLPHLMGHEGGGIVTGIGSDVTTVKVGDHVVMHWRKGDGIESALPVYKDQDGNSVGAGSVTTFNTYAVVSENRVTSILKNVPFEIAALMGCAVTTGLGIVFNDAKLSKGQSIAVAGCGGVGLNVIQGARIRKADRIVAIDRCKDKLGMAKDFGATDIFHGDCCSGFWNGDDVDVFVDCTGDVDVISLGYSMAKKTILVGQPKKEEVLILPNFRQNYCGKILMDSQGGATNPTIDIPKYLEMYMSGELDLDSLITHRFPLDGINLALDMARSGQSGRCIVEM